MSGRATIALLGDLMLGGRVSEMLHRRPPDWIWGDTLPVLHRADAVLANLEGPITAHREPWRESWKFFHYRADPAAMGILRSARLRFAALANNHILDFGVEGLRETLRHLDSAAIAHAGAGEDLEQAAAPAILELPGLRLGLIAATDGMPPFAAGASKPGTNHIRIAAGSPALDWVEAAVRRLRRDGAATILLSLHWGPNMRRRPATRFRDFARAAIDRGVDIFHGHSAHIFQAVECHRGGVILYDTGNFIDDYWNFWNFGSYWSFPFRHDDWSFVFLAEIDGGRPQRLRLLPVRTRPWPLGLATGRTFDRIVERMARLSAEHGTAMTVTPQGLEIPVPQAEAADGLVLVSRRTAWKSGD